MTNTDSIPATLSIRAALWRHLWRGAIPGLIVGATVCVLSAAVLRPPGTPGASDREIGSYNLLMRASWPVSALTAEAGYQLKERFASRIAWRLVDYLPVLVNCAMLSSILIGVPWFLLSRWSGQRRRAPST